METRFAPASDQQLLAWRQRDPGSPESQRAASELLGRYRERVYLWCRRYVHEHERALDLSQDVLLTAYEHLDELPARTRFGAWVYTVTRNRCLLEIRRMRVRECESVDPDDLPDPEADPEERLLENLAEERFLELIGRTLDAEEQEAICLRCFERLPVDEVTRIMGLHSATGARGLLQRARRKLRAELERQHPGWDPKARTAP